MNHQDWIAGQFLEQFKDVDLSRPIQAEEHKVVKPIDKMYLPEEELIKRKRSRTKKPGRGFAVRSA